MAMIFSNSYRKYSYANKAILTPHSRTFFLTKLFTLKNVRALASKTTVFVSKFWLKILPNRLFQYVVLFWIKEEDPNLKITEKIKIS